MDDDICGCFKIEKYIIEGYFLGSKFYAVMCYDAKDAGRLTGKCKMKGVKERYR